MQSRFTIMAVAASVALLVGAAASGTAFALVGNGGGGGPASPDAGALPDPAGPVTARQEAEEGFLARLAENLGISEEELREAVAETEIALISEAAANGRIPQGVAEELIERVEGGDLLPLVPRLHRPGIRPACRIVHGAAEPLAELLGLTPEELAEELRGPSLAAVAAAHGISADEVAEALVAEAEEHLQRAVEEGRVTQERADAVLAELTERVTAAVNGELRPCAGPPGRFFAPPEGMPPPEPEG